MEYYHSVLRVLYRRRWYKTRAVKVNHRFSNPMSLRPNISKIHDIKKHVRTVSPSNSISTSIEGSDGDQDQPNHKQQNRSESTHWSLLVPVIGMTIMMWAQRANARVRQHATACCTGDFCVGTDTAGPTIPEEIIFQKCKNQDRKSFDPRSSLPNHDKNSTLPNGVGTSKTDIELTTFEASSIVGTDVNYGVNHASNVDHGYDASWTVPHPIRRTKWNEIPYDPVDEVSLKGSSMYMSDGEDDLVALPYDCDDNTSDYRSKIRELQLHCNSRRKMR